VREIALDFQPRRPGLLSLVVLLAGLLLCADAWFDDSTLRAAQSEAESRLAASLRRAERAAASRREARPESVFPAAEAKALGQAVAAIGVDWEALYRAIDRATSDDVALLAIRPNVAGRTVQISGEARDIAAALAFVDALRQGAPSPLAQPVLISHQTRQNDPQHPIVFEIAATWRSAS